MFSGTESILLLSIKSRWFLLLHFAFPLILLFLSFLTAIDHWNGAFRKVFHTWHRETPSSSWAHFICASWKLAVKSCLFSMKLGGIAQIKPWEKRKAEKRARKKQEGLERDTSNTEAAVSVIFKERRGISWYTVKSKGKQKVTFWCSPNLQKTAFRGAWEKGKRACSSTGLRDSTVFER